MKKLLPVLALSLILSSCENPLSTMKEMKDNTEEMLENTKEMNEKMNQTNQNTDNLGVASRHGFTEDKRDKKRDELFPESDMGNTITDAKIWMLAFEFQSWDGVATKAGLEEREHFVMDALDELYQSLSHTYNKLSEKRKTLFFIPRKSRLEKMSPLDLEGEDKQMERTFYAIATTLHVVDFLQERSIEQNRSRGLRMEEINLYDVITNALIKEKEVRPLSQAEARVTIDSFKEMAKELLQARMNFITALALKELVTQENMSLKEKASGLAFKLFNGGLGALHLDSKFDIANYATQEDILVKMEGAVKTKKALEEMGVRPVFQKEVKSILENLDPGFIDPDDNSKVLGVSVDLHRANNRFIKLYNELMAPSNF